MSSTIEDFNTRYMVENVIVGVLFAHCHDCFSLEYYRAGSSIESFDGIKFLSTPPVAILIDQKMIENSRRTSDGERITNLYIQQELFGVCCSVDEDALILYGTEIKVKLEKLNSGK